MTQSYIARIWLILSSLFIVFAQASAQMPPTEAPSIEAPQAETAPLTELTIRYNKPYQFQSAYSVIYDNTNQPATLKDFKIIFYGPSGVKVGETPVERYPREGQTISYNLADPVVGFQSVNFVVLSLHDGNIADFPQSANAFLALNEMSEYVPPEPVKSPKVETVDPTPKQIKSSPAAIIKVSPTIPDEIFGSIDRLSIATGPLMTRLESAKKNRAKTDLDAAPLSQLNTRIDGLQTAISDLQARVTGPDVDVASVDIDAIGQEIITLTAKSQTLESDITKAEGETAAWLAANPVDPDGAVVNLFLPPWVIAALAIGTALLALVAWTAFKSRIGQSEIAKGAAATGKSPTRSRRPQRPSKIEPAGVVFAGSPLLALSPAPLSSAGTLAASQLSMLTGRYAVLRPAYAAVGRLGFAQEGKPTRDDYSLGTGFLISDRHVMTNRHVHGFYGQYLTGDARGGIEFIAEKDNDASDFMPFNGEAPYLIPNMDIAIYTLSESVTHRAPIAIHAVETEDLLERDIVVIGYPDTHKPDDPTLSELVEDNPIFAVKRISQGRVFRHSSDTDCPLGVEVRVDACDSVDFPMDAICHNASTMGGNSGSPILDLKTGQLLGVHFAGHKIFNAGEAANLAMAVEHLNEAYKEIDVNNVFA
ncbi:serine protease [Fretibacter rubidus]|uniref:trypsin-like serine peptidase n=1 Tax=Fretibacter rubidus TaxID=570162 RepID=UPI00352B5A43